MSEKKMFGRGKFGGGVIFKTEVVNGVCPTCQADAIFVSIANALYRCTHCGTDLEQKVNGVIQYIPVISPGGTVPVLGTIEDGSQKA